MKVIIFVLTAVLLGAAQGATAQPLSVQEVLAALGKGPTLGSPKAPVSVVEFSDFQCSFCKRFWSDTLPALEEAYIKKGQARFTYRHFAILGRFSEQAAQAAECSAEQGRFWEYHDMLFKNQGRGVFTDSNLKRYAEELKLNSQAFSQCLDSGKYRKKVEGETAVGASLGLRGTPSFFVNSRLLVGAQPFEAFRQFIEEELEQPAKHNRQSPRGSR